jgi:hypothetical protein
VPGGAARQTDRDMTRRKGWGWAQVRQRHGGGRRRPWSRPASTAAAQAGGRSGGAQVVALAVLRRGAPAHPQFRPPADGVRRRDRLFRTHGPGCQT